MDPEGVQRTLRWKGSVEESKREGSFLTNNGGVTGEKKGNIVKKF